MPVKKAIMADRRLVFHTSGPGLIRGGLRLLVHFLIYEVRDFTYCFHRVVEIVAPHHYPEKRTVRMIDDAEFVDLRELFFSPSSLIDIVRSPCLLAISIFGGILEDMPSRNVDFER